MFSGFDRATGAGSQFESGLVSAHLCVSRPGPGYMFAVMVPCPIGLNADRRVTNRDSDHRIEFGNRTSDIMGLARFLHRARARFIICPFQCQEKEEEEEPQQEEEPQEGKGKKKKKEKEKEEGEGEGVSWFCWKDAGGETPLHHIRIVGKRFLFGWSFEMALVDELDQLRSEIVNLRDEVEGKDRTIAGLYARLRDQKERTFHWQAAYNRLRVEGVDRLNRSLDISSSVMAAEEALRDHGAEDGKIDYSASDEAYSRID